MIVAKDEKDGDIRRLLRRVTNRAKSIRRQRSKSAHGHLQSVRIEHSIDDAVAAAAAVEKQKQLSNDELHTMSSPDLRKEKRFTLSSKLRDKQKGRTRKTGLPSSSRQQQTELVQQHKKHACLLYTSPSPRD